MEKCFRANRPLVFLTRRVPPSRGETQVVSRVRRPGASQMMSPCGRAPAAAGSELRLAATASNCPHRRAYAASTIPQLLRASALRMCSAQVGLCKLLCASALCNCSVQVALRKLLCASDSAQVALRKCCRSCGGVLRVLRLYLKVAILQPELRGCAPRTTFALKSCDFPA